MDVDTTAKYIVTAGADKKLTIWNIDSAKAIRNYKTETGCLGASSDPLKVEFCPGGTHFATSSADKVVRLYDFFNGKCIAKAKGHSEVITSLKFTSDCRRLVTVSADGCIFIWALAPSIVKSMQDRYAFVRDWYFF